MASPDNALQAGIYTRLTGFAALTALVSTRVYDFVPEDAAAPYVVIGEDTFTEADTKSTNRWEATITIHVWDFEKAGRKSVKSILSAIFDALHRQESNISVNGFTLVEIHRENQLTFQEDAVEGQGDRFYHGVARYRAIIHA